MGKDDKREKIVIVGFGWVGQANAIALSLMGHDVYFFDPGEPKEHYAEEYGSVYRKLARLDKVDAIDSDSTYYIVCVGDRVSEDRVQDMSFIEKALDSLKGLKGKVILRSTILPQNLGALSFDYYLPEFLHEKYAVEECLNPFYFVVGSKMPGQELPSFLKLWEMRAHKKTFSGTPEQASYIKYLSNVWNSVRIAFVNEFGNLIKEPRNQENINEIERIMDYVLERGEYLKYGRSFGGHCLPKDLRAFIGAHPEASTVLLEAMYEANDLHRQKEEKYKTLPEWFSKWEYGSTEAPGLGALWSRFNTLSPVRKTRGRLRFIKDWTNDLFPKRSVSKTKDIWNRRIARTPRYYMNTKTRSGKSVDEKEMRESGRYDYEKYVLGDALVKRALGDIKKKNALEVGCGVGRMTEFFAKDFDSVDGVDFSDLAIYFARQRLSNFKNVSLIANDGQTIPSRDENYDFIFSYLTLQHMPDRESLMSYINEMHRVTRLGGVAKLQLRTGPGMRRWRWSYGVSLSPEGARKLAGNAGFKVLQHEVSRGGKDLWLWLEK